MTINNLSCGLQELFNRVDTVEEIKKEIIRIKLNNILPAYNEYKFIKKELALLGYNNVSSNMIHNTIKFLNRKH